jgi:hypothetical protein
MEDGKEKEQAKTRNANLTRRRYPLYHSSTGPDACSSPLPSSFLPPPSPLASLLLRAPTTFLLHSSFNWIGTDQDGAGD